MAVAGIDLEPLPFEVAQPREQPDIGLGPVDVGNQGLVHVEEPRGVLPARSHDRFADRRHEGEITGLLDVDQDLPGRLHLAKTRPGKQRLEAGVRRLREPALELVERLQLVGVDLIGWSGIPEDSTQVRIVEDHDLSIPTKSEIRFDRESLAHCAGERAHAVLDWSGLRPEEAPMRKDLHHPLPGGLDVQGRSRKRV